MAYFPFFMDLNCRPGLIIGGGKVALRKIQKLLPYGPVLTVVAPDICPEIKEISGLILKERPFVSEDVCGAMFVIAATDSQEINRQAAIICQEQNCPVNVADDAEKSSFLFPALIKQGALTVGISTGGSSPTAAQYIKEEISKIIPEQIEEILDSLHYWREKILSSQLSAEHRSRLLKEMFSASLTMRRALTEKEVEKLLQAIKQEEREP